MITFGKILTVEEAFQILNTYLINAENDGDDLSMERDALARIMDELSDLDAYVERTQDE